jgi:hypothetical protein
MLLDAPRAPSEALADVYLAPDVRARSIAAAKAKADAYIDGVAALDAAEYDIELQLVRADGAPLGRGSARDRTFAAAVAKAVAALEASGALPRVTKLDEGISRWDGISDVETGLLTEDLAEHAGNASTCDALAERAPLQKWPTVFLHQYCHAYFSRMKQPVGPIEVDRTSRESLVNTLTARFIDEQGRTTCSDEDRQAITELAGIASSEPDPYGAAKATGAESLFARRCDPDRARTLLLSLVEREPEAPGPWYTLASMSPGAGFFRSWELWMPWMWYWGGWLTRADPVEDRMRYARRNYELRPGSANGLLLVDYSLEAKRLDDARAIASRYDAAGDAQGHMLSEMTLARIDERYARFGAALTRLRAVACVDEAQTDASARLLDWLLALSDVMGKAREVADEWIDAHLADDGGVWADYSIKKDVLGVCLRAERARGLRCLERAAESVRYEPEKLGPMIAGARRFVLGDVAGAMQAWKPLARDLPGFVPVAPLDAAGFGEATDAIDASYGQTTAYAGITCATPHVAKRALARRDRERARELAQSVVDAWSLADVDVPAVAEMKRLLAEP